MTIIWVVGANKTVIFLLDRLQMKICDRGGGGDGGGGFLPREAWEEVRQ